MKKSRACFLSALPLLTANVALANGFYIPVQAPEATARGNAWLATADSAAAVYYNAAGLTQIDSSEVVVGGYAILLGLEADTDFGNHYKADNEWAYLPQFYAAVPVTDKLVAGFGVNTPFGLGTHWDEDSQFRQLAIDTELTYVTGWAVLGYKITDTFSIGGGLGVSHADATLRQGIGFPPSTTEFEFSGEGEALSWTVSARWEPCEMHSFGLVYRSKSDFNLDGDSRVVGLPNENADLDFMTPSTIGAGYAFSPCKNWTIEANIEWVNWDELNSLDLDNETLPDQAIQFDWNSNFIYSIGATHYFDNGWNISAGYNFIENSQPDETFNPGISDANRHWLNAGFGGERGDFKWNFAYQYAFSDRDVSGSPGTLADGEFESRFHGIMANFNWRF